MLKHSAILGSLIAFAMLIAVAAAPHPSVVVTTPAGMDMSALISDSGALSIEAWDAF